MSRFDRRRPEAAQRINHRIRVPEIRVLFEDEQLGIMPTHDALRLAEEKGLDLVEISPGAKPPVCRIVDYGKYKYDEAKREQKNRKAAVGTKEIKFRPKTELHDIDFKVKHVRRFLEEGHKVRLVAVFRGREIVHPETGKKVLDRVVELCSDIANVELKPNLEGKRMIMGIAPKPGVVQKAQQAKERLAGQPGQPPQQPELDEAAINADVIEDDED